MAVLSYEKLAQVLSLLREEDEQHTMCPGRDLRGGHFGLDQKLRIRDSKTIRLAKSKNQWEWEWDGIR